MYLFDLEDYNCNEVPTDWEDYATSIRENIAVYMKCIKTYIKNNQGTLSPNALVKLNSLVVELTNAHTNVLTNLSNMMDVLSIAPLNCFDKTLYTSYISSYKSLTEIGKEISNLISTGGDSIGSQPDIESISTTIYPTNGITKPTITKCVGVYMKQMDNGSEFRGKVTQTKKSWDYFYNRS